MPKPLSKIREENRSEFDKEFPSEKGVSGAVYFVMKDPNVVKSHLSTSESRIVEGIKEWAKEAKKPEWKGFGGYDAGFNDALADIAAFLDEGLTSKK